MPLNIDLLYQEPISHDNAIRPPKKSVVLLLINQPTHYLHALSAVEHFYALRRSPVLTIVISRNELSLHYYQTTLRNSFVLFQVRMLLV